jgi:hypothetical protein
MPCTCDCHKETAVVVEEDRHSHKVGLVAGFMAVAVFSLFSYVVWMIMNGTTSDFDDQAITLVWVIVNTLGNFMSAILGYLYGVKVASNTPKLQGRGK